MPGIFIESYLVDQQPATPPPGFAVTRTAFASLPGELELAEGWTVIVYAPTGSARAWLNADPDVLVSGSDRELIPHSAIGDDVARPAARLVIRRAGALLGAVPLAAGIMGTFRAPLAMLEIVPLSWEIRAGAMRGGSPGGARLELAWRTRIIAPGILTGGGANGSSSQRLAALG